jgi:hypothetical protein
MNNGGATFCSLNRVVPCRRVQEPRRPSLKFESVVTIAEAWIYGNRVKKKNGRSEKLGGQFKLRLVRRRQNQERGAIVDA